MDTTHKPVLLDEVLSHIPFEPGMTTVDATLGGGSYAREFARKVRPTGRVIAFDADAGAIERFRRDARDEGIMTIHANYSRLEEELHDAGIAAVDVIVADLGLSSDQLEDPERGMSFLKDGPLDMRLDRGSGVSAEDVVNRSAQDDLAGMFHEAGEPFAKSMAREIVASRREGGIHTTHQLVETLRRAVPERFRIGKRHFCTKAFMAIRMRVNDEAGHLARFLVQTIRVLRPGGYVGIVSFHSGEDAAVKDFFRRNARGCICPRDFPVCGCGIKPRVKLVTRRPVVPGEEETRSNPRARSAKLRIAQKLGN
jgi:16S rRNA (cytosine1402-N4)-methyltransferase